MCVCMFISEFLFGSNNTGRFNASGPALHETTLPLPGTCLIPKSPPIETPTQKHMKLLKDHMRCELPSLTLHVVSSFHFLTFVVYTHQKSLSSCGCKETELSTAFGYANAKSSSVPRF